jgi:hypothetical protein
MVKVDWMLGLRLLTAVEFIVRGLGFVLLAVLRLTQVVVVYALLSRVQERGVMRDGKIVRTTMRYDVASKSLSSWNEKIRLAGDDYVLGDAIIGAVGIKLLVGINSKAKIYTKVAL